MNIKKILNLFRCSISKPTLFSKAHQPSHKYKDETKAPYKGRRVRLTESRGCMAQIRHNPQEGIVVGFEPIKHTKERFPEDFIVQIKLENGETKTRPATPWEWSMHDRLLENCL